jgi:hypothetical protein
MKTSELTGAALDWAVAQAEGNVRLQYDSREGLIINNVLGWIPYRPSVAWQQGGPIIEREKLGVWWAHHVVDDEGNEYGNHWYAETGLTDENADERHCCITGETPLIAAMRCYVASKLGDEVEIPKELTI